MLNPRFGTSALFVPTSEDLQVHLPPVDIEKTPKLISLNLLLRTGHAQGELSTNATEKNKTKTKTKTEDEWYQHILNQEAKRAEALRYVSLSFEVGNGGAVLARNKELELIPS